MMVKKMKKIGCFVFLLVFFTTQNASFANQEKKSNESPAKWKNTVVTRADLQPCLDLLNKYLEDSIASKKFFIDKELKSGKPVTEPSFLQRQLKELETNGIETVIKDLTGDLPESRATFNEQKAQKEKLIPELRTNPAGPFVRSVIGITLNEQQAVGYISRYSAQLCVMDVKEKKVTGKGS
jgi:hypothetical protein